MTSGDVHREMRCSCVCGHMAATHRFRSRGPTAWARFCTTAGMAALLRAEGGGAAGRACRYTGRVVYAFWVACVVRGCLASCILGCACYQVKPMGRSGLRALLAILQARAQDGGLQLFDFVPLALIARNRLASGSDPRLGSPAAAARRPLASRPAGSPEAIDSGSHCALHVCEGVPVLP